MVRIKLRRRRRVRQEMVAAAVAAVAYHLKLRGKRVAVAPAPTTEVVKSLVPTSPITSSWVINWRYEVSSRLCSRGRVRGW